MSLKSEIEDIFQSNTNEPLVAFEKAKERLETACNEITEHNPDFKAVNPDSIETGYLTTIIKLREINVVYVIDDLLLDWWNAFGLKQKRSQKRMYREIIALWLGLHHLNLGNESRAFRWLLHTQADDIFAGGNGGAGRDRLGTVFGFTPSAFTEFNDITKQFRNLIDQDWSQSYGFAEHAVREFIEQNTSFSTEIANIDREFPISKAYFATLVELYRAENSDKNKKGQSLETLASYLMSLLPGCIPRRNLFDEDLVGETDILVHNLSPKPHLVTELLGRDFLIECKNTEQGVGVSDVGYFLYRMRLCHVKFGIIFSKTGITGSGTQNEMAARALIRRAFHEDGNLCVIIDDTDLVELENNIHPSFWMMLLRKIEEFRFGRSRTRG